MSKMKRVTIPMDDNLVKLALINAEQNINALMDKCRKEKNCRVMLSTVLKI